MNRPNIKQGCVERCRACAHRPLSAQQSEQQKSDWLKEKLSPWRDKFAPLQSTPEQQRWHYRNKVVLHTEWQSDTWQFGMRVWDELLPIPHCPIHSHSVNNAIQLLSEHLPPVEQFPMAYFVQCGKQLTLILKSQRLPKLDWCNETFTQQLRTIGIEGFWIHLHPSAGRRLFAKNGWHLLWGEKTSRDEHGLSYGPSAFQQLIPHLYHQSLDKAEQFLSPDKQSVVIDLYCGIGASMQRWLRHEAKVIGVELGGDAVNAARQNTPQADILRGKCEHRLPQLSEWLSKHQNKEPLLYLNPPRTGLDEQTTNWIINTHQPQRIAYLSCSAGTLLRDLNELTLAGYKVDEMTPYDFFPQTYHVETLTLLSKSN